MYLVSLFLSILAPCLNEEPRAQTVWMGSHGNNNFQIRAQEVNLGSFWSHTQIKVVSGVHNTLSFLEFWYGLEGIRCLYSSGGDSSPTWVFVCWLFQGMESGLSRKGWGRGYLLDKTVSGRIQNSEYTVFSSGHGPSALHICRVSMCGWAHDGLLIKLMVKG